MQILTNYFSKKLGNEAQFARTISYAPFVLFASPQTKRNVQGQFSRCKMDYSSLAPIALVGLCAEKDPMAWKEFIGRYRRPIALTVLGVLRNWGELSTRLLDDLVQETYVTLCANDYRLLRQFAEKHSSSLNALLRVVAANVTHDHMRARNSQKRGGNSYRVYPDCQRIEGAFSNHEVDRIERIVQLNEIDRLLRRAPKPISSNRDRTIFWLHFRSGMSAQAISEVPSFGLTAKGVESLLYRTLEFIRKGFKIGPD